VRHAIVHNRTVVEDLKAKGAIFVEDLDEIPDTDAPIVFSAHGVAKRIPEAAARRRMFVLDATCPLVSKVHVEAERQFGQGREILLIGHGGHPEVVGTMVLCLMARPSSRQVAGAGKFPPCAGSPARPSIVARHTRITSPC
jgi:4-hydroxy-3-methylbut-2-enyl diphosphate reductase